MSFWLTLVDLFLPRFCVVCDTELCSKEDDLCNVCLCNLNYITWKSSTDNPLLRSIWNECDVEAAGSSLYYNSSSEFHRIFIAIKYRGCPQIGKKIAQMDFPHWKELGLGSEVDYVIPVPLALLRRLRRGYNQAEWIAKGVSLALGKPVCTNVLVRSRGNSTQTHKTAKQRHENVRGIFAVRKGVLDLNDKVVLLVDDIMTTGSTICECIRALREEYPTVRVQIYTLGWSGDK